MKVSAVVLTHNEEVNVDRCLSSLGWCDDVLVVDSGSSDRTLEICAGHGVRVAHHPFENFSRQRNWALEHGALRHEWVLHLDADEATPPDFAEAIRGLDPSSDIGGYRVPSRTIFFGQWLKRSGMYPVYQVRLGHRDRCRFYEHGHGQRELLPPEQVALFPHAYDHHAFSHGIYRWLVKHAGYARAEAAVLLDAPLQPAASGGGGMGRRRALKAAAGRLPPLARPLAKFLYMAVIRGGLLDGPAGLIYCVMHMIYEAMIAVLLMEGRRARRGMLP